MTWKEAQSVAEDFLQESRLRQSSDACHVTLQKARYHIYQSLVLLTREPDIDVSDQRISPILAAALSPVDIDLIVGKLLELKHPATRSTVGSTSCCSGAALPPRVSEAAAPAADIEMISLSSGVQEASASSPRAACVTTPVLEPVSSSSASIAVPPKTRFAHSCTLPPCRPQNQPACNKDGRPCSHYQRTLPPSVPLDKVPLSLPSPDARLVAHEVGKQILQDWLHLRPALAERLKPMRERPFFFFDAQNGGEPFLHLHDIGCWVHLELKEWMPPPPQGTVQFLKRPTLGGNVFEQAVHCCSMYTVMASVLDGVWPGPEEGRGGKTGVYAFRTESSQKLAWSSSGYCVYEALCGHDIFFGPRLLFEVQTWRAGEDGIGNIGVGAGQLCLQPGMFHLRSVVVHMMTPEDLRLGELSPDAAGLWFSCGRWQPEYEWAASSMGSR